MGRRGSSPQATECRVSAESGQPIEKVRLRYPVLPDGSSARAVPDFQPGVTVSAGLILGGDGLYLAPGTRIDYHWEVEDESGETATTPEASIVYEDVRFEWRALGAGGVGLHSSSRRG